MTPFYLDSVSEDTIFLTYGAIKETVENVGFNVIKKVSVEERACLKWSIIKWKSCFGDLQTWSLLNLCSLFSGTTFHVRHFFGRPHRNLSLRLWDKSKPRSNIRSLQGETWALHLMKSLPSTARCSSGKPREASFLNVQNSALWTSQGPRCCSPSLLSSDLANWGFAGSPGRLLGFLRPLAAGAVFDIALYFSKYLTWNRKCATHITGGKRELESGILEFRILLCHLYLSMQGCCLILWTWRFPLRNFRRIVHSSWRSCKHYVWQHIKALSTESGHNIHLIKGKSNRHPCSIYQGLGIAPSESNLTHLLNPL